MEQEQNTQTENHRKFPLKRVLLVCIPIVTIVLAVIINTGVQTGFFTRMSREFQSNRQTSQRKKRPPPQRPGFEMAVRDSTRF